MSWPLIAILSGEDDMDTRTSKEMAYRDALVRIRQICRSNPRDFVAAATASGEAYDIANKTLDANGDLFVTAHEPEPARPTHELSIHIARLREPKYNGDAMELRKWAAAEIEELLRRFQKACAEMTALRVQVLDLEERASQPPANEPKADPLPGEDVYQTIRGLLQGLRDAKEKAGMAGTYAYEDHASILLREHAMQPSQPPDPEPEYLTHEEWQERWNAWHERQQRSPSTKGEG